jgi:hypothetical protein
MSICITQIFGKRKQAKKSSCTYFITCNNFATGASIQLMNWIQYVTPTRLKTKSLKASLASSSHLNFARTLFCCHQQKYNVFNFNAFLLAPCATQIFFYFIQWGIFLKIFILPTNNDSILTCFFFRLWLKKYRSLSIFTGGYLFPFKLAPEPA